MRYYLYPSTYTCILLSLLTGSSWSIGDVAGSVHYANDYLASTLRRMQEQQQGRISDRRGRTKSCTIDENCSSTFYMYKDFEATGGVTFAEANTANAIEADLEKCVLAPIYSYQDLIEISDAIPPCKAAYTAAYKDPLQMYREARACVFNGRVPFNCDFATLGDSLEQLWGKNPPMGEFGACSLQDWFGDDFTDGSVWCPALRSNWVNFGSTEEIPSDAWSAGDSSYCGDGPIQNAAAAFSTDYSGDYSDGEATASLKALNSGEKLPGAVYKCCQDFVTCFEE